MAKKLVPALGLALLGYAVPLQADDSARAVFSMICIREAQSLGHKDEALRTYVNYCVAAKMRVYDEDMSNPLTAHLPKSC